MPLARRQFREAGVEVAGLHPQLVSCSRRFLSTDAVSGDQLGAYG